MKGIENRQLAIVLLVHKKGNVLKKAVNTEKKGMYNAYWLESENGTVLPCEISKKIGESLEKDGWFIAGDGIQKSAYTLHLTERAESQLAFWEASPPYAREMDSLLKVAYKLMRKAEKRVM
ncbi:hypothetical protein [Bacillus thuringiensis]|uniref:hypothetical protein n=1 Tax=Bacillus thuringiensis TaxID=1428 RepID=UPI000BFC9AC0|nr:hypothetical protein [Bacillus thuringiensis]PGT89878.1 hypothetical protein COD17_09005 [Bacillus thuringiensis]